MNELTQESVIFLGKRLCVDFVSRHHEGLRVHVTRTSALAESSRQSSANFYGVDKEPYAMLTCAKNSVGLSEDFFRAGRRTAYSFDVIALIYGGHHAAVHCISQCEVR